MGKKNKKVTQIVTAKKPIYSDNQLKAYEFLANDKVGEPPQCDACKRVIRDGDDVYEVFMTGMCGFCQGWNRLPPEGRMYVINILKTDFGPQFLKTIQRIISIRPNADKLV